MWFAAKQQTIDGVLKKTVQTSHAKSVPFLPVSKAYLLSFQRIGSKNKRPDIVCYTTTRKYRELQLWACNCCAVWGYTTTRKYRELQRYSCIFIEIFSYTTTRKYRELQPTIRYCVSLFRLYHYEKIQGTTTDTHLSIAADMLYHYEKIQGTTTVNAVANIRWEVIPLRENTGNCCKLLSLSTI